MIGSKDLYDAVAVSGTASMFLIPVIFFSILGNQRIAPWALVVSFAVALVGAAIYMLEAGQHINYMEPWFGYGHKYSKLLILSVAILVLSCTAFALARQPAQKVAD